MVDAIAVAEQRKYQLMWEHDSYRERSPGMRHLQDALKKLSPPPGSSFVDLGCGTGRVSAALRANGFQVTAVDIAQNACTEFDGDFISACLWDLPADVPVSDFGFCADVMEHLPTEKVTYALECISKVCHRVYFQIANFHCHEGDKIGEHLHLTVKSIGWWNEFLQHCFVVEHMEKQPKHHIFVCKSRAF